METYLIEFLEKFLNEYLKETLEIFLSENLRKISWRTSEDFLKGIPGLFLLESIDKFRKEWKEGIMRGLLNISLSIPVLVEMWFRVESEGNMYKCFQTC